MKQNPFLLLVAASLFVAGGIFSAPAPTPTPTPTPGLKIKTTSVATPAPTYAPRRTMGATATPKPTPVKIDKSGRTGKTQTSTPAPLKITTMQTGTPTPTPGRTIKNQGTATNTPIKVHKDPVVGPNGRPGPINLNPPPTASRTLIPGQRNLPPDPVRKPVAGVPPPNPPPQKKINYELRIYTKNGHGTSSTNLNGEFPVQLDVYANIDKDVTLRWARSTAGGEEKGNLYVAPEGSTNWVGIESVTMPAGSTTVNIPYTLPNLAPNTYNLQVAGDDGNSNTVKVNFGGGSGGGSSAIAPLPTQTVPPPAVGIFTIVFTKFKPMEGTPGQADYKRPRLSYTITANSDIALPVINIEIDSEAFSDPNTVTSTGPASYQPQKLFGKQQNPGMAYANKPKSVAVDLDATSDPNWFLAYGKTGNATFKWSASGQLGGSANRPVHTAWP